MNIPTQNSYNHKARRSKGAPFHLFLSLSLFLSLQRAVGNGNAHFMGLGDWICMASSQHKHTHANTHTLRHKVSERAVVTQSQHDSFTGVQLLSVSKANSHLLLH